MAPPPRIQGWSSEWRVLTFRQLVVLLQEAEPVLAGGHLLALLAGNVLFARRLQLVQVFIGDVLRELLQQGVVLLHAGLQTQRHDQINTSTEKRTCPQHSKEATRIVSRNPENINLLEIKKICPSFLIQSPVLLQIIELYSAGDGILFR